MTSSEIAAARSSAACCPKATSRSMWTRSRLIWCRRMSQGSVPCRARTSPDEEEKLEKKDKDYEDFVKAVVNPGNQTPRGLGYALMNPKRQHRLVIFDDCEHSTGTMIEAKRGYAKVLSSSEGRAWISEKWLDQSLRQVQASGWRRVRWYFSTWVAFKFAREIFRTAKRGQRKIGLVYLPFAGDKR